MCEFQVSGFGFRVNPLLLNLKTQNSKLETTQTRCNFSLRLRVDAITSIHKEEFL